MPEAVRLGVIVPSVNIVVEEWYPRVVPDEVSVHFARMLIADGSSPEKIIAMDREDGMRAIGQIASCRPHAVAYGCTASSVVQGHAFDKGCAVRSGILPGFQRQLPLTASSPPAARLA